ncbi:MAG: FAD-dependent monooxygenase [Polyangiales bacterium]
MSVHSVVIVGGGPTGLMLAAELALARVDVAVVERRVTQEIEGFRAGGLHPRSLEALDQRGVVDRFVALGQKAPVASFSTVTLDVSDMPTRHNYRLALAQSHIERLLAEWADALGVTFLRGTELTDFSQDNDGVTVTLSNGQTLRTRYLVGCDGGRSLVRKKAGIGFPGTDPSVSYLIAEATLADDAPWGMHHGEKGNHGLGKTEDGRARLVIPEASVTRGVEPTVDALREALVATHGSDFGLRDVTWLSRFSDMARQAAAYRAGRVFLAGDAAHVHSPVNGQGLNTGLQDAVNLGWKLAQVLRGTSPDSLLDTYHAERHPVGARVLHNTLAATALGRGDPRSTALRENVTALLALDDARKRYGAMMTGLDIRYDLGEGHPLLGRRVPDLDLTTDDGPTRVFALLHDARPVLLTLDGGSSLDITPWADRVKRVDARASAPWDLPGLGAVSPPAAVLIRPDGHAAWVGDGSDDRLRDALTRWFGPASGE